MNGRRTIAAIVGVSAVAGMAVGAPGAISAAAKVAFATNAMNAQKVNHIEASRTPERLKLVPLGSKGTFAPSTLDLAAAAGKTYSGVIGVTGWAASAPSSADPTKAAWAGTTLNLVPYPTAVLGRTDMGVAAGGVELPECEGTFAKPTAPPGRLCVYPGVEPGGDVSADEADVVNVMKNGEGAYEAYIKPVGRGLRGVYLEVEAGAPGKFKLYATWAYTAPLAAGSTPATP